MKKGFYGAEIVEVMPARDESDRTVLLPMRVVADVFGAPVGGQRTGEYR